MEGEPQPASASLNRPIPTDDAIIVGPNDIPSKPGKARIEIPSRRSANAKTFLESDGTFSVDVYRQSIFYKNNKKQWVPIEAIS